MVKHSSSARAPAPHAVVRCMPRAVALAVVGLGLLQGSGAGAQTAPAATLIDVQAGDTFSAIAARFTGDLRSWRQLYHPQLSGLPRPDRIQIGMRLELVTDAGGSRYLRVVGGKASRAAAVAAAPAPTPASPSASTAATAVKPAPAPVAAAAAPAPAAPPPAPAPGPAGTTAATAAAGLAAAATAAASGAAAAPAPRDDALVVGVLPNIGAAALQGQYEHLKRYLERLNPQKVRIVLPSNFKVFFDNTLRGDYDLAVAAPHFARVAQLERAMTPLVMYEPRINGLFVAPVDGAVASARDLREKALTFANPSSLVAMYGLQWLAQQKMEPGKDFEVKAARTDMGVGRMMLSGEASAAIMSNGELRALPPDESSRLKIVEVVARIPNFIVLANPRLDRERTARLKAQLKDFIVNSEEGAAFARATGFTGITEADEATLRELDPYVAPTRRAMGMAPR